MTGGALKIGHGFGCTVLQSSSSSSSWSSSDILSRIVVPAIILLSIAFAAHYGVVLWQWIKKRGAAAPSAPTVSLDEVKKAIDQIGMQLTKQQQSMQQIAQRVAALPGDSRKLTEVEETVRQANKEVLEFIYSQVNRATADSLGEVLDSMKSQIRDLKSDLGKQLQDLARESKALSESLYSTVNRAAWDSLETVRIEIGKQIQDLTKSVHLPDQQPSVSRAGDGTDGNHSNPTLESPVLEKKPPVAGQKMVVSVMSSLPQSNHEPAPVALAATAQEVATGVETLEQQFRGANLEAPPLAARIRMRLLDLSKASDAQQIAPGLDEVISRDLTELVRICDSAGKNGAFNDGVRKLLEAAHLQDTSPRVGDRFDPAKHIVVDFEHGDPGIIIRTKTRGFQYKQQVLRKPEVIVGM